MITVNVGELLQCDDKNDIQTRGCDPCVALIVIYKKINSIEKKCAHFSLGIGGRPDQNRIEQSLNQIIQNHFPLLNINSVGITWGGRVQGMGGNIIFNRLVQYFNGQVIQQSQQNDSISTNGLQIVIANNQVWPWTHDPATNDIAEIR